MGARQWPQGQGVRRGRGRSGMGWCGMGRGRGEGRVVVWHTGGDEEVCALAGITGPRLGPCTAPACNRCYPRHNM